MPGRGGESGPTRLPNAEFTAKPGQAGLEALLRTPFVQDTLRQIFSGQKSVADSTLQGAYGRMKLNEPERLLLDQNTIARFNNSGMAQPVDKPELILAHEATHSDDLLQHIPKPLLTKFGEEYIKDKPEFVGRVRKYFVDSGMVPEDITEEFLNENVFMFRDATEGIAEGMQHALAFISDRAPYDKADNQNLHALEENAPGATVLLSWIADRMGGEN